MFDLSLRRTSTRYFPASWMATQQSSPLRSCASDDKFSSLPHHIIQSHIFPRLDGPTLIALGCVSTRLRSLCSDQHLWRRICTASWPSVADPRLHQTISTFPSGYCQLFSNSFPLLHNPHCHRNRLDLATAATRLISAVDIYHRGTAVYSQVDETVTNSRWFMRSIFRIHLDPAENHRTGVKYGGEDEGFVDHLEKTMSLSWILIDPARKRAVNLSSRRPVSVRRFILSEVVMQFQTVVGERVKCEAVVTCGRRKGGELHVRQVWMQMVDMEEEVLSGRDSLVILEDVLGKGRTEKAEDGRKRMREFERRKTGWKLRKERRRRVVEILGISSLVALAFAIFMYYFL